MNRSQGKRVAVYTRISKDRYEDQSDVTRQKADCEEFVVKLKADGQIPADAEIQHYCGGARHRLRTGGHLVLTSELPSGLGAVVKWAGEGRRTRHQGS